MVNGVKQNFLAAVRCSPSSSAGHAVHFRRAECWQPARSDGGRTPPACTHGAALRLHGKPGAEDPVTKAGTLSCYLLPVNPALLHSERRASGGPKRESSLPELSYTTLTCVSLHQGHIFTSTPTATQPKPSCLVRGKTTVSGHQKA